uniref:BHLH domain-containing protein n=1 Tax=Meloidogyne floridensis TaxID=298350 RepID=A0A915P8S6_9BILA
MLSTDDDCKYLEATCSKNELRKGLANNRISTRGASKLRRDQINNELTEIRNILPLNTLMKQNLFQLQVLSLSCTFIRCHHYFRLFNKNFKRSSSISSIFNSTIINAALNEHFLLAINEEGKLLVLSDNFSQDREPISTIEWMAQSDSLFDLIDIRDHQLLQENLFNENGLERISQSNEITFVCRWRPPKLGGVTKRQPDWNGKPTIVNGYYISFQNDNKGMFVGFCRPLLFSKSCFNINYNDPSIMKFWMDKKLRIEALCQK